MSRMIGTKAPSTTCLPTTNYTHIQSGAATLANGILPSDTGRNPTIHHQVNLVILVPLSTVIILCNLLVLGFLVFNTRLHKPSYFFVGCMSFADLTVGCVAVWTTEYVGFGAFVPCLVRMGLLTSAVVASLYCMGWIAVDRYIAITEPFRYKQRMTKWRAVLAMWLLWTVAFCIGFAPLMGWDVKHSKVYCSFCYIDTLGYEVFLFLVGFGIPMSTTILIYILLFKNARVHIRRMEVAEHVVLGNKLRAPSRTQCFWKSRRWRASRTLVLMISCFLVTWCPFVVTSVVQLICDDACQLEDIIGTYLLLLGFCNSFMNPVIYAASNKEFKDAVCSTWKKCRSRCSRKN